MMWPTFARSACDIHAHVRCVCVTVAKSVYYKRLWASFFVKCFFFFCKVAGENPWSRVAFFGGLFKKIWLLVREI